MINYLSSSFIYTKVANLILWFNADLIMGIIYGIIFVRKKHLFKQIALVSHDVIFSVGALLFPEPTYSGPDNVIYFRGAQGLQQEITKEKNVSWLIAFYTVWNPACVNFAPTFAKLSTEYNLSNLKFGKIDIGRYPDAAKDYRISDSSFSKQLPTLILFQDGKEVLRRPTADSKGKIMKFLFSDDNIRTAFGLNNLYNTCKMQLKEKINVHDKKD